MRKFPTRAVALAVGAAVALLCGSANAQSWPTRPVTLVVPYAPGGPIDVAARVIARELSDKLGQQFVIEHRAGAGGSVGAAQVSKSRPDGYTLLLTSNGPAILNKLLYESVNYDPETDLMPVSLVSEVPQVFITNPKAPYGDMKEMLAYAKQKGDALTIGHAGAGTAAHLTMLWLAGTAGIGVLPVSYRGSTPIVTAVLGGEIDAGLPAYIPQAQSTKVIAVTSPERVDFLPGVPTVRESGIDLVSGVFTGMQVPVGVPAEIVTKLNRALDDFLKTDDAKKQLTAAGAIALGGPPERLTERISREKAQWAPIIKSANIRLQ
jgi:tripartite-type tricarboxylate transporter receptor subunit TctC